MVKLAWGLTAVAAVIAPAFAQDATRTERVQFAKGAAAKSITGSVKGYDTVVYVVSARAGQTLTVGMKTSNASSYFTIRPPGSEDALFDGTINGNDYRGKLPATGDYRIMVFLMRNAARRNEVARYTLNVGVR